MVVAFDMCSSKHISKYVKDTTINLVINHYYTSQAFILNFLVRAMASNNNN